VQEPGLAHPPYRLDAAGDTHPRLVRQLFHGFGPIPGQHLRDRVAEIEALSVSTESGFIDRGDAAQALVQNVIFERQADSF
jgi:hypothetical protein